MKKAPISGRSYFPATKLPAKGTITFTKKKDPKKTKGSRYV